MRLGNVLSKTQLANGKNEGQWETSSRKIFGLLILYGVVALIVASFLFCLNGRKFEPTLNLPFVLGVYSAVLVIYKFLYIETAKTRWDPAGRIRLVDLIQVGFLMVFVLTASERFLYVLAKGENFGSCVERIFPEEASSKLSNFVQPSSAFVRCIYRNLTSNFTGGDLLFLITLFGMFIVAQSALAFVTENPDYGSDRLALLRADIASQVDFLKKTLMENKYNVRFFPPCVGCLVNAKLSMSDEDDKKREFTVNLDFKKCKNKVIRQGFGFAIFNSVGVLSLTFVVELMFVARSSKALVPILLIAFSASFLILAVICGICIMYLSDIANKLIFISLSVVFCFLAVDCLVNALTIAVSSGLGVGKTWIFGLLPMGVLVVAYVVNRGWNSFSVREADQILNLRLVEADSLCSAISSQEYDSESAKNWNYYWVLWHCVDTDVVKPGKALAGYIGMGYLLQIIKHYELMAKLQEIELSVEYFRKLESKAGNCN